MSLPDITSETVPSGIFNLGKKRIALSEEGIQFDKKRFLQTKEMKIAWRDIDHISYGLGWLTGYYFSAGLRFEIRLKTVQNKIYTISFLSIYGIGKQKLYDQYINLIRWLWEFYLNKRADRLYDLFCKGEKLLFGTCEIAHNGIRINKSLIPLSRAGLLTYREHFILQDNEDVRMHQKFIYKSDWDAVLFQPILNRILEDQLPQADSGQTSGEPSGR